MDAISDSSRALASSISTANRSREAERLTECLSGVVVSTSATSSRPVPLPLPKMALSPCLRLAKSMSSFSFSRSPNFFSSSPSGVVCELEPLRRSRPRIFSRRKRSIRLETSRSSIAFANSRVASRVLRLDRLTYSQKSNAPIPTSATRANKPR